MIPFLILALGGCDYGLTLPSSEPGHAGPLVPSLRLKARTRQSILPASISGPPQPEAGITSDQCDQLTDGGPIEGPGCVTGKLHCGETIIGHTVGGVQRFDSRFYEKQFCAPKLTNHDGGDERVYRLDMPEGDWTAVVTLDTPCADLDLAGIRWDGDDCPSTSHLINQCEMYPSDGKARERVRLTSQHETSWFVVVEGKNEEEGAFSLTVQCFPGLGY